MNNRFFQSPAVILCRIVLVCVGFLWGFMECRRSPRNADHEQLKMWIDSLDRDSRRIGIPKSISMLDSLMATLDNKTVHDSILYYKFMKVLSHRDSTRAEDALMYTDSLLQLFAAQHVREQNPIDYSKALLLKGDDLLKQKAYYQAYRNYYHGKSFLTARGEICECARYSSRIANISFKEENYYQAIEYWKQELKELAKCGENGNFQLEFIEKQGSMRNIGIAYLHLNEADKALEYFDQANRFIDQNEKHFPKEKKFIKFARLVILKNQAEAFALKGHMPAAEKLIKKCLQHDPDLEWSIEVEQDARQVLTRIYIDSKAWEKAREQLAILKNLPGGANNAATTDLLQKLEAATLFGLGKYKEAGSMWMANIEAERIQKLKRNVENKNNVGQLVQQIEREREVELAADKDAREALILTFAILMSIALCVIIYLIWRDARKNIRNLRAVTKLNGIITQSNIVLQDTVNALEQSEIENENVLQIVAHDLRNPIAAMISGSDILFYGKTPDAEQSMIIDAMKQSGRMANGLIKQILQSTPERNKLSKHEADLGEIVQSCINMLRYKAKEKNQGIAYDYEQVMVPVDREKIWRVISNLLSNAIKFSPYESAIRVSLQRRENASLLTIQDDGIGIPDDLQNQIFLPSNQAKRAGTAGEQSFGIGLSICKQIVEAHGGRIWFESVSGKGSRFFVELPVGTGKGF